MIWSVSNMQLFKNCPRKWFFSNNVVYGKNLDDIQQNIKSLKSIQTIYAWRGIFVDSVITNQIIPILNKKQELLSQNLIDNAKHEAITQIHFMQSSLSKFSLFEIEYENKLDDKLLNQCLDDIELSLKNLLKSKFIQEFYEHGTRLVAQRSFSYNNGNFTVRGKPDVLAFYNNRPPMIVDWKVHQNSHMDHLKQLSVYAVIVSKCNPHKDLVQEWNHLLNPTKIDLLEFQLLHGRERMYNIDEDDVVEIEDFIFTSGTSVIHMFNDKKYPDIKYSNVPTTQNPHYCSRCKFKKVCWEDTN